MSKSILVTGGSGFLGGSLIKHLAAVYDCALIAPLRAPHVVLPAGVRVFPIGDFDSNIDWCPALEQVDVVIHCAARVHVMKEVAPDPLMAFRRVNVDGTLRLARQAAAAGVKRFIFISSIKVNGERTQHGLPYRASDTAAPVDPYGISKMEAEQGLRDLSSTTAMQVVIIRPVLAYGPGVKANFLNMMRWLDKGIPLPFGAIHNRRSLVAVDNLIDLIVRCIDHPKAANETFLVSDGEDVSTTELLIKMSRALAKPARLLPVPCWMMQSAAALLGKADLAERLFGSLQVDITKNLELLNWKPPVSMDDALRATAQHFLENRKI